GPGGELFGPDDGGLELRVRHGGRGDDAQPPGVGGGRSQLGAGDPAHAGLDDRVLHADESGEVSRQCGGAGGAGRGVVVVVAPFFSTAGTSRLRMPRGSITSRIRRSSSADGSRVTPASARPATSKPVFAATSSAVTPGCRVTARMVRPGPWKSKTPRLVTTFGM